jgi:phosphoribosylamine--glycine ligase
MAMRILVVGGGGREHALVWKLAQSERVAALWCAPGNPGTAELAESVPVRATDVDGIVAAAARLAVDLVVVGPEAPLAAGLADRLAATGLRVCGPTQAAARLETSKAFAKEVMAAAGVPTARAVVVREVVAALAALSDFALPVVIKADGLAAGKGVVVAESRGEAQAVLTAFLEDDALGPAGRTVVVEECLRGQEVSIFALVDGERMVLLPSASDYKRVFDGDRGPNTGGMGAYAPPPAVDRPLLDQIATTIIAPALREMAGRDIPYRGVLYAGLMLTADGPRVLEFNARFGDPEAQVILPVLDADLAPLLAAVGDGALPDGAAPPLPAAGAAAGVVLAAGGYPAPFQSGLPITGLDRVPDDVLVFHAGTRRESDGRLVTAGGRVLTVVGRGPDLAGARERAYAGAAAITFPDVHNRRDVALAVSGPGAA